MGFKYTVGCETTGVSEADPCRVLQAFSDLADPDATLLLICKRDGKSDFSARNFIEENSLGEQVTLLQYYDRNEFHDLRNNCKIWIGKNAPAGKITADNLGESIESFQGERIEISDGKKHTLFFTGFHPFKEEGQASYMRMWLDALAQTGHEVHLVHYQTDLDATPPEARFKAEKEFSHYHEIPVDSLLVGKNRNGLNVDLDDWCGREALEGVASLVDRYDYDFCFVFYPFFTAVFTVMSPQTRKVLVTPDSFTNRNRKMMDQGYQVAEWVSITREGEEQACRRADIIVSIKEAEASHFRRLAGEKKEVITVASLSSTVDFARSPFSGKLRIGYLASDTRVNRDSVLEFLACRADSAFLSSNSLLFLAGRFSEGLEEYLEEPILQDETIKIMGRLEDLVDLYREVDLIINPERGGTGLKIKTLEPMYFGMPVVSTLSGAWGLNSGSRFHQADEIGELIPLLEEIVRKPGILEELSASSREIAGRMNRVSREGISKVLGCSAETLEPGVPGAGAAGSCPDQGFRPGRVAGEPLISVVLPFFNAAENLESAVRSVTEHDYSNLELILVDDASDDASPLIAEKLAETDPRIRIVRHPRNQGAGPARNTGVLHASGEYLFFLDSDDILRRRSLGLLAGMAAKTNVSLVIGSCNQVDEHGNYGDYDRRLDSGRKDCFGLIEGTEAMRRSLNVDEGSFLPVRPWGMLIDLEMFRDSGLTFPSGEYEDLSVIPFLYLFAGKVVYLEDIVVTYRIRKGSVTQSPLNLGKVERYHKLWEVISGRIEKFGVEGFRSDFQVFHAGHLLWLLNQGVSDRRVLMSVAELIQARMSICPGAPGGERKLGYMMDYINSILGSAGLERDFELWERFVSSLGEEAIASFFRHKMHENLRLTRF